MEDIVLKLSNEEAVQLYIALSNYLKLHSDKYIPIKYKTNNKEFLMDEFNLLELKVSELREALSSKNLLPVMDYIN